MGYFFGWLIGCLIYGCIFGFITQHVAESKGYSGGFAWGFFLGIIGLLVVGFRPNIQSEESPYTPMYGGTLQSAENSKAKWTCVCGARNREGLNYCPVCRRTREESNGGHDIKCPHCGVMNNSSRKVCLLCDKPLDMFVVPAPSVLVEPANNLTQQSSQEKPQEVSGIELLEKLAKLHEQGILTDEEFSQKKADVLAKM